MMNEGMSRREFVKVAGAIGGAIAAGSLAPRRARAATQQGKIRFGVQTPPQHATYQQIADVWKEADELGYDSAFTFDHFMPIFSDTGGPCFEGWTLLAALAAQTRRIQAGVLVTGNTYRNPVVVAKMAATIDHACNGRLILGMGAAWFEAEHTAYGFPFHTVGGRARRLDEAVQVLKLLFTQAKTTYSGKYYQLKDAPFEPKAVQKPHPPILIGGVGPKLIQPIVAKHADIWNFFADPDAEKTKALCQHFDEVCRKVGRDPAAIEKSAGVRANLLEGSNKEVRARIQSWIDAGARHFIISLPPPYDRALVQRFAKEVIPAFRSA
jgi:F420-dependent oxidoreductase-like protein